MEKAVFLDRGGVVIKQKHHLHRKEDLELTLNSGKAIKLFNDRGYLTIVVKNQSVVVRGLNTIQEVHEINHYMKELLEEQGAKIDKIYFCPHHPTEGNNAEYTKDCNCRKPKISMFLMAKKELEICLEESYMICDKTSDIQAGKDAGCKTILVEIDYEGIDEFFIY
jgi:D-glycero-D-manno-heptose 1,7-bisphosphate phosphatase